MRLRIEAAHDSHLDSAASLQSHGASHGITPVVSHCAQATYIPALSKLLESHQSNHCRPSLMSIVQPTLLQNSQAFKSKGGMM